MIRSSSVLALGLCAALFLSACGGGDGSDTAGTNAGDTTAGESVETGPISTETPPVSAAPATVAEVNILTDFGDVCRGVALPGATPYDRARAGVHPLITMAGADPSYEQAGAGLPDQWDPVVAEEHTVELVACLARTSATLRKTCDGYLDDAGVDTGNTVEMYDAGYDVNLVAATTGEVIASTQFDAIDDVCPSFVFFDEDATVKPQYAEPTEALTAWIVTYVEI